MPCEEAQVAEALPTALTLVGPLGQVQLLVDAEALGPPEGLPTLGTGVGLLPAVNALVVAKVLLGPEGLATIGAEERPLPSVHKLVPEEVGLLLESLPAVATHIGPVLCVDFAMLHQTVLQAEGLSTQLAAEGLLTCVVPLVAQEVGTPPEGLAALEALEQPGPCVHCLVSGQPAVAAQRLPTRATDERRFLRAAPVLLPKAWPLPAGLPACLVMERGGLTCLPPWRSPGELHLTHSWEEALPPASPFLDSSRQGDLLMSPGQRITESLVVNRLP